jgi:hypothetical protein
MATQFHRCGEVVHGIPEALDEPVVWDQPPVDHGLDVVSIADAEGLQFAHDDVNDIQDVDLEMTE